MKTKPFVFVTALIIIAVCAVLALSRFVRFAPAEETAAQVSESATDPEKTTAAPEDVHAAEPMEYFVTKPGAITFELTSYLEEEGVPGRIYWYDQFDSRYLVILTAEDENRNSGNCPAAFRLFDTQTLKLSDMRYDMILWGSLIDIYSIKINFPPEGGAVIRFVTYLSEYISDPPVYRELRVPAGTAGLPYDFGEAAVHDTYLYEKTWSYELPIYSGNGNYHAVLSGNIVYLYNGGEVIHEMQNVWPVGFISDDYFVYNIRRGDNLAGYGLYDLNIRKTAEFERDAEIIFVGGEYCYAAAGEGADGIIERFRASGPNERERVFGDFNVSDFINDSIQLRYSETGPGAYITAYTPYYTPYDGGTPIDFEVYRAADKWEFAGEIGFFENHSGFTDSFPGSLNPCDNRLYCFGNRAFYAVMRKFIPYTVTLYIAEFVFD